MTFLEATETLRPGDSLPKSILILGNGGNCIDILDTITEINRTEYTYDVAGFLDDNEQKQGKDFFGVPVVGSLSSASKFAGAFFINGIGSPLNFWKKQVIIDRLGMPLNRFETIVHPSAVVSKMARLGRGTVVFQNVVITSNVEIGNHVIILPNSVISHDNQIGDYTSITGGVCLSGGVKVGRSCYLGSNSSIIENVEIGDECLIGMGSVLRQSVGPKEVWAGNPAKFLRKTY